MKTLAAAGTACTCACHQGAAIVHVVPCCHWQVGPRGTRSAIHKQRALSVSMIVAGGQTGVDQAALRAAQDAGLRTGGWCPPGCESDDGPIPPAFGLRETPEERSRDARDVPRSQRTEWNVRDSDATLILRPRDAPASDPGTDWTITCAQRYGRQLLICDPTDTEAVATITRWLGTYRVATLNVAGPSEGTAPTIGDQVYAILSEIFTQ